MATERKKKGGKKGRKIGRNSRRIRYPLMPDGLTVQQAWWWYDHKYAQTRNEATQF